MKTMLVTLGDRPAVEVEVPAGKGAFWIYRDLHDHVFSSRKPPAEVRNAFVLRHVKETGDVSMKPGELTKLTKKGKKKALAAASGDYPWEDEAAS